MSVYDYLSLVESLEAIVDSEHLVSLRDAHPDGRADSSVHARCGGSHIQHSNVEVTLQGKGEQDTPLPKLSTENIYIYLTFKQGVTELGWEGGKGQQSWAG